MLAPQIQSEGKPAVRCHQWGQRRHSSSSPRLSKTPVFISALCHKMILCLCYKEFSFQAWHLPSWRTSLLSTASTPLSFPSSLISLWAPLTRWSRVNQSDLATAISCNDSDKLQKLLTALQLLVFLGGHENRRDSHFFFFRYICCPQHYGGNCVPSAGPGVGLQSLQRHSKHNSRGHSLDE